MEDFFRKGWQGYQRFRDKYAQGDDSVMRMLADYGQRPSLMVVSCCDSRVDPALILQCDPGDLFVVRNVANIIPPYEKDINHHGTSAALEFGICALEIKELILLGHSQCGGIRALLDDSILVQNDFISNWVSLIHLPGEQETDIDEYAKLALHQSLLNCLTFPWLKSRVAANQLTIHLWFFDVKKGEIQTYDVDKKVFAPL